MTEPTTRTISKGPHVCNICRKGAAAATVQFSVMPDDAVDPVVVLVRACTVCSNRALYLGRTLIKQIPPVKLARR